VPPVLSVLGLLSAPLFVMLLGAEIAWSRRHGRAYHIERETVSSLAVGVTEQAVSLLVTLPLLAIYASALRWLGWTLPVDSVWTWLFAAVALDFLYYWYHRAGHEVRSVWALHVVHHQARDFNLSVAVRNSALGKVVQLLFAAPLAVAGVPLIVLVVVKTVMNLFMFLQHTRTVGRIGWIERIFVTPSSHRVHHAINPRFVNHNYGGILIIWDHLFGTYQAEDEPCEFDRVPDHPGFDPVRANTIGWEALVRDVRQSRTPADVWRAVFGRPAVAYPTGPAPPAPERRAPLDHYAYLQLVAAVGWLGVGRDGPVATMCVVAAALASLVVPTALLDRRSWAITAELTRLALVSVGALAALSPSVAIGVAGWSLGSAAVLWWAVVCTYGSQMRTDRGAP